MNGTENIIDGKETGEMTGRDIGGKPTKAGENGKRESRPG
jgi:hypothetical protein